MTGEIQKIYTWWFDAGSIILRYFVMAGTGYFVFYVLRHKALLKKKIQNKLPQASVIRSEIFHSTITLSIYCAASWLIFEMQRLGITRIYLAIQNHGYGYFVFSIGIMVIAHDAYFYWTHRLMHLPGIFKWVHRTHHLSDNPTPWAAFSFHPLEAIISIGIIPLIVLFIPCHPLAVFLFLTYMTLINVMGHLGFELFPKSFMNSKIGKWQNTSTNHNIHHCQSNYNFGLYFTFWDRIMGTYNFEQE